MAECILSCFCESKLRYFCEEHYEEHGMLVTDHVVHPPVHRSQEEKEAILSAILRKKSFFDQFSHNLISNTDELVSLIHQQLHMQLEKIRLIKLKFDYYLAFLTRTNCIFDDLAEKLLKQENSEEKAKKLNTANLKNSISKYFEKVLTSEGLNPPHSISDFRLKSSITPIEAKLKILALSNIIVPKSQSLTAIYFSAKKSLTVVGYNQGYLEFFNIFNPKPLKTLKLADLSVNCISETFDSNYIIVGLNGEVGVIKLSNFDFELIQNVGSIREISPGHNLHSFVTGNRDGTLATWKVSEENIEFRERKCAHTTSVYRAITGLVITFDDKFVISAGTSEKIKVWDFANLVLVYVFENACEGGVKTLAACNDLVHFASVRANDEVKLWDFQSRTLVRCIKNPGFHIEFLEFSLNGLFLIAVGPKQTVVWNISDATEKFIYA